MGFAAAAQLFACLLLLSAIASGAPASPAGVRCKSKALRVQLPVRKEDKVRPRLCRRYRARRPKLRCAARCRPSLEDPDEPRFTRD